MLVSVTEPVAHLSLMLSGGVVMLRKRNKNSLFKKCFLLLALVSLSGCGGSGGVSSDSGSDTGVFLDSAVEGLGYVVEGEVRKTDQSGGYQYNSGDSVVFKVGSISLPEIEAEPVVTPLTVFDTASVNDVGVVNLSRLLQSLDLDGIPENGIKLPVDLDVKTEGMDVDFRDQNFGNRSDVINLVANSGSVITSLVSAEVAIDHLASTLDALITSSDTSDVGDFVIPTASTEDDPSIRNSIAWYRSNPNLKLYSRECLTRVNNDSVAGWVTVAIAVQVNGGISQESNMWRSISACSAVPFWLDAGISFEDTIRNIECQPGPVFEDSRNCDD